MISQLRRRASYANVTATLALVLALTGGAAYAASHISGSQLKKRSVAGAKLKKNTVTGTEVNESKLGKVPRAANADSAANSAALGGTPASGFIGGSGKVLTTSGTASNNSIQQRALTLPGFGDINMNCNSAGTGVTVLFTNGSGSTETASVSDVTVPPNFGSSTSLTNGNSVATGSQIVTALIGVHMVLVHVGINGSSSSSQIADAVVSVNTPGGNQPCNYQVHALISN